MKLEAEKDWLVLRALDDFNIKRYKSVEIVLEKGGKYIFRNIQGDIRAENGWRIKTALVRFPNSKNPPAELGFEIIMLIIGKPVLFQSLDKKTGKMIAEHKSGSAVKTIMAR